MPGPTNDQTLPLRDGRNLGFAVYGDPDGTPEFFLHGFPGSRLGARIADKVAARLGIRVIALDRPGFGLSDFKTGRTIADWPDDLVEAADILGADRFAVIGLSAGSPYAAACAFSIPHRLTSVAIVSGMSPLNTPGATVGMRRASRVFFALAPRLPWITRLAMWWIGRQARHDAGRLLDKISARLPLTDKAVLARPEVRQTYRDDIAEAFRQGGRGPAWDLSLLARPWGFRLEDIKMEVHIWHGEADTIVSPSMGRHLASAIPNSRARFYPGEGHTLALDRMEEIQTALFPYSR
ncbi:MAG: alpha/beta fold hydrolase [Chloroflexi bacterium]|nr:alpha/beta fold hydrolase [Chloroflexota bacterium]